MSFEKIFENNAEWIKKQLATDHRYFEKLSRGQSPEILYIGCADSRVTAESIMGLEPGDVFVHRNVANVVPNDDMNIMSVLNYAVVHLKVDHIVVCGHYNCGGVKAAMDPDNLELLNPWIRNVRDVYRLHKEELDGISDLVRRYNRFVELNVQEQCTNVLKTPEVQRARQERNLQVHGWVFDLGSGKIIDLKLDVDAIWSDLESIYRLDV